MIAISISKKSWTGSAKEATPGTAITTPTLYIPTVTSFVGKKKAVYLNEERGDRNANYGVVDSVRVTQVGMKGPFYFDTSPIALWGGLGLPNTVSQGGTPTAYKHNFQLQDVPATYTIFRHLDARSYYVPYGSLEKFTLQFTVDGKLLDIDSTWQGLYAVINSSPPTPSFSTVLPTAGYAPTIKFVDGVTSSDVVELQLDYSQKLELWYPANGSPDIVTIYFGERDIKLSLTARFDNDTLYQRFRTTGGVMDSLTFDVLGLYISNAWTVSLGAPSAGTFTLTYNGQTTGGIAYNATAATVQTALTGLSTVGAGNATVSGAAGGPYTVIFTGTLAQASQSTFPLSGSGAGLTGGTFSIVSALTQYELNMVLPNIHWDDMEHDTSKTNVMIKAKATAVVPAGSSLITGYVINGVSSYTT